MKGSCLACFGLVLAFMVPGWAGDNPVLPKTPVPAISQSIDRAIQKQLDQAKIKASPRADDAEFCRRVYLDITGKIPPPERVAAFLDSQAPDKRAQLIDELLASSDYGRHFGIIWRTHLAKRDEANKTLNLTGFADWIGKQFNENRPWNQVVFDMLTAEGSTDKAPQGMFFLANRDMIKIEPAKVVGSISNLFLGIQMQCAECHNHPFTREWKQQDFWGMAAFFGRVRDDNPKAKANRPQSSGSITETASKGGGFFRRPAPKTPAVTGGVIAIPSPVEPGKTIGTAKAKFFEGPEATLDDKAPYRPVFATWATSPQNKYFARAAVNRMWGHFFGRGLVNPIEDMQDANEASHPELLKLLTDEFVASGFDLKHLIRCLANSQAYQRTSAPLAGNKDDETLFSHMMVRVMSAEVLYDSLTQALGSEPSRGTGPGGGRGPNLTGRQAFVNFFDTKEDSNDATDTGHGIPQYLLLMNSFPFNRTSRRVQDLAGDIPVEKGIETLFLSTLSRRPTPTEVQRLSAYVAAQPDRKRGYDGVMWILVNCAEFICVR